MHSDYRFFTKANTSDQLSLTDSVLWDNCPIRLNKMLTRFLYRIYSIRYIKNRT